MRRAAIVSPLRTAVGAFGGSLRPLPADQLAATILKALIQRSGIDPARIDDVVMAQSYANSEAPCLGRYAALEAGLPVEVPGMTLDRRCGSGLQAVIDAAMQVQTGAADVVVAAGVESMSNIEYYSTDMRWGSRAGSVTMHDRLQRGRERSQPEQRFGYISGMPETAENLAKDYGITREEADAFAMRSHQRAAAAWQAGKFADELVSVAVPQKKGEPLVFARDEGIRAETTMETLVKLKPVIKGGNGDGRQRQPAERRRRGLPGGGRGQAGRAEAGTDRLCHGLGGGRLRAGAHGHRPRAGGEEAVRAHRPVVRRRWTWSSSMKLSRPRRLPCSRAGTGTTRTA